MFSIKINDVFMELKSEIGFSLFADIGAIWKRGNLEITVKKLQGAIKRIKEWSYKSGFKFSVKTKSMLLQEELELK